MTDRATSQADDPLPPRRGKVLNIGVDGTARSYDLTGIDFPDAYEASVNDWVFVTVVSSVACWVLFHSATASDMDDTAKVTAGSALAHSNTYGFPLAANVYYPWRINRKLDTFLQIKAASGGSGILTIYASSKNSK